MIGFITTWLVVLYGTIQGLSRPAFGAACYFWLAILRPELLWFWAFPGGGASLSKFVAAGTLLGWGLTGGVSRLSRTGVVAIPFAGFALFLLSGTLSTFLWAANPSTAQINLTLQLKIGLIALVMAASCRSMRDFWWAFGMVLFGLSFFAWELNLAWVKFYRIPTNLLNLHGDNNNISLLMVSAIPMGLTTAFACKGTVVRCLGVGCSLMGLHAVLFLESRGAYLATAVVLSCFLVWAWLIPNLRKYTILGFVGGLIFVGMFAGDRVVKEWNSIFVDSEELDDSAQSRIDLAKAGLQVMQENPFGLGPRQTPRVMERFGFIQGKLLHNMYVQVGADWGVLGLLGYLLFYGYSLRAAIRVARLPIESQQQRQIVTLAFGLAVGIVGYLVGGLFLSCERIEIGVIGCSLALGLSAVAEDIWCFDDEEDEEESLLFN